MQKTWWLLLFILLFLLLLLLVFLGKEPDPGKESPSVTYDSALGTPRYIGYGDFRPLPLVSPPEDPEDPEQVVQAFFRSYAGYFRLTDPSREMQIVTPLPDLWSAFRARQPQHVRVSQFQSELPVFGGHAILHLSDNLAVKGVSARVAPAQEIDITPSLSEGDALAVSREAIDDRIAAGRAAIPLPQERVELGVWVPALFSRTGARVPVYRVQQLGYVSYVNARDGALLLHYDNIPTGRDRYTYDYENVVGNPNPRIALSEHTQGCPEGEVAELCDLHAFLGETYDFFFNELGRDGIDDTGMTLTALGNYEENCKSPGGVIASCCPNAWGSGTVTKYCTGSVGLDVVAHEFTHGVTSTMIYERATGLAGLKYEGESGALAEAISDIFGVLVDANNWTFAENANFPIRNLADPPSAGDPDHISALRWPPNCDDSNDWCYMHSNCCIPGKAAWLLGEGGTHHGFRVAAIGRRKLAHLAYSTYSWLDHNSSLNDAGAAMMRACRWLVEYPGQNKAGLTSADCAQVVQAMASVGMLADVRIAEPKPNGRLSYGGIGVPESFFRVEGTDYYDNDWEVTWRTDVEGALDFEKGVFFLGGPGPRLLTADIKLSSYEGMPIVSTSIPIQVVNDPPMPSIERPAEGESVPAGFPYALFGKAFDQNQVHPGVGCDAYRWKTGDGSDAPSVAEATCNPVITFGNPGPRVLTLQVEDAVGGVGTTIRTIVVVPTSPNSPPLVRIDFPKPGDVLQHHERVMLVGQAKDPDGDTALRYEWKLVHEQSGTISLGTGASLDWTPESVGDLNTTSGYYANIVLEVEDATGLVGKDKVRVYISWPPK